MTLSKIAGDYRHQMCCNDCWAFLRGQIKSKCRIALEQNNHPIEVPREVSRLQLSGAFQRGLLELWPCEYRYTKSEVEMMQNGKLKDAHITKADIARVLEKVTPEMKVGNKWEY